MYNSYKTPHEMYTNTIPLQRCTIQMLNDGLQLIDVSQHIEHTASHTLQNSHTTNRHRKEPHLWFLEAIFSFRDITWFSGTRSSE